MIPERIKPEELQPFDKLEDEFNAYRNSVYTTKSSAPVLADFLWFKGKLMEAHARIKELEESLEIKKLDQEVTYKC